MSGISFPTNLTVHIDPRAILFDQTKTPEETAQILLAYTTQGVWGTNLPSMSYWAFSKKYMFPGNNPKTKDQMNVYLGQFLAHLENGGRWRIPGLHEKYKVFVEKIQASRFFPSFRHFFDQLKKDIALGKKHTVVFRILQNDFKSVGSIIQETYPDIEFSYGRFMNEDEKITLHVLDPAESTSDLDKMQKIFNQRRYWLIEDSSKRGPFPCYPHAGRIYCFLDIKERGNNHIEVEPEEAALDENYFLKVLPKQETVREIVRTRQGGNCSRTILIALALAIVSCLIPDSFFKPN